MAITYQSENFNESQVVKIFIKMNIYKTILRLYKVNARNLTIQQQAIDFDSVPKEKLDKAFELSGQAFGGVEITKEEIAGYV